MQDVAEAVSPAQWGTAAAWRASTRSGGSPGQPDGNLPGDSNGDGIFNSSDLVAVFQAGKYEDDVADNASFAEGDWNGDGDFTTADLVFAFQNSNYVAAARAYAATVGTVTPELPASGPTQTPEPAADADQSALALDALFADLGRPRSRRSRG